ncbi:MAG: hypothetical protein KDA61_23330, partial [Planctomycetales bacterium]|nr:hypothetical protein [Planctomycetales bacterium]
MPIAPGQSEEGLTESMQEQLIANLHARASEAASANPSFLEFESELCLAYLIRCVEELFLDLFSKAKVSGTVHTCIGQELVGVAVCKFLRSSDWITSNHRCHGHFIAKTGDWRGLIDELLGLSTGVSKGIGSSQHLFKDNFISNGTQGSLLPVGSGIGLSRRLRGQDDVVVSFIGEGTLGEGNVYEAMNLSSILDSQHLIVCENNYYSQTTPQASAVSGSIELRARAFGLEYFETNTWNCADLLDTCEKAISFVRANQR